MSKLQQHAVTNPQHQSALDAHLAQKSLALQCCVLLQLLLCCGTNAHKNKAITVDSASSMRGMKASPHHQL
jgi:hypothetical protein